MSVCTACGEFYTYAGRLHCSLEHAPIRAGVLGKYEIVELVAVMWSDGMAARFPKADHAMCRQDHTDPDRPVCYGWHCNRCGVPTSYQGHNNCPDRPEVSGA